jgi:glyoxylase-like metal-dependent hydrolase (beta-lactamase superfamily II)
MKLPDDILPVKCQHSHGMRETAFLAIYILTGKKTTSIDTGLSDTPSICIFPYFEKNKMNPKDLALVINSHGHMDHAGGNGEIKERTNAKFAIHKLDVKSAEDHELHFKEFIATHPKQYTPTKVSKAMYHKSYGKEVKIDIKLDDGDVIEAGDRALQVIHTPGHSYGSMCLYDKSDRILFTGDAIQGRTNRPCPCYMDADLYMSSLQKVDKLNIDIMCLGHNFKPFDDSIIAGQEVKTFVSESMKCTKEWEENILSFLEKSTEPQDLGEIAQYAIIHYNSLFSAWWFPPNNQVLNATYALLQSLEKRGKVLFDEKRETWQIK